MKEELNKVLNDIAGVVEQTQTMMVEYGFPEKAVREYEECLLDKYQTELKRLEKIKDNIYFMTTANS